MSFGYADETDPGCRDLSKALELARSLGVLVFAAASNGGAISARPAFPARHSSVFCIYACDGVGNSSRTTLTAQKHSYNFSTPGEAIKSAWPGSLVADGPDPWKQRKSGTSFATPIAAGIAALVLLYARQNMSPEEAERFREYDKMKHMLFTMSNNRQKYDVISPKSFFDRPLLERNNEMANILRGTPWIT